MLNKIQSIHTLGPKNTNCESAAKEWFHRHDVKEGKVFLYNTLEEALENMPKTQENALLGCVVYPYLHNLVFNNLNTLEISDLFIHNTYDMVLASRFDDISSIKTVATHPAPSSLLDKFENIEAVIVNSNSRAALDCKAGVVDSCITTLRAAVEQGLNVLDNFGPVPMGFSIHTLK